jgi:hypothetical protein
MEESNLLFSGGTCLTYWNCDCPRRISKKRNKKCCPKWEVERGLVWTFAIQVEVALYI